MQERIQKILSKGSFCSRRDAEEYIAAGRVKINGQVATLGQKCSPNDEITLDDKKLDLDFEKVYYLLNKPKGYISSTKDEMGMSVVSLIKSDKYLFPVGRLDVDTTGLIIITNDGEFSRLITLPSSQIPKTYIAKIDGILVGDDHQKLKNGLEIESGYTTLPALQASTVKVNDDHTESSVKLTIIEGKKNQVKEMFAALGRQVINLTRIAIGDFMLDSNLELGEYRQIDLKEIRRLVGYVKSLKPISDMNNDYSDDYYESNKSRGNWQETNRSNFEKNANRERDSRGSYKPKEKVAKDRFGVPRFESKSATYNKPKPTFGNDSGQRGFRKEGDGFSSDRGPRQFGDRPMGDRPPRQFGDRPQRSFGDRPGGDRGPRQFGDRPPRSFGDRPQRSFGDRPGGDRGPRQFGDRPPRSFGDRPQGDRPPRSFGDRPQRSFGDRPDGDRGPRQFGDRPPRSFGDRPQGDRPPRQFGDRPGGDRGPRQFGDRPPRSFGDRPQGDRPPRQFGDRPGGDRGPRQFGDRPPRSFGDRPQGDRPPRQFGDRPGGDRGPRQFGDRPPRSFGDRPQGDRPPRQFGDRPGGDRGPRQFGDRPPRSFGDRPQGDRPPRQFGDRPQRSYDRPQGDRPQRSYDDRSSSNSGSSNSGSDKPWNKDKE